MHRETCSHGPLATLTDPRFAAHAPKGFHPERPDRLAAAERGAAQAAQELRAVALVPRLATRVELERVHTQTYLDRLETLLAGPPGFLDADTYYGPASREAAWLAAGSACVMVDALLDGTAGVAALLARPPGHHAMPGRAMGFCLLNNIAVAAAHARHRGIQRIAIVDWDVHHGNGTQAAFYRDPAVVFISLHESPLYPETGAVDEIGEGPGRGSTFNIPLPTGSDGPTYARAFDRVVLPVLRAVRADLVLISAGFDAHARDPLAGMQLQARDYRWMASRISEVAALPYAPIGLVLEGGYDLEALEQGVEGALSGLVCPDPQGEVPPRARPGVERILTSVIAVHRPYWPGVWSDPSVG